MTIYSQRNAAWYYQLLGFSGVNIGNYGCAITCLGMLANKTPLEVNNILKKGNAFLQGSLVIWEPSCKLLGLTWYGTTTTQPSRLPCIAQVRGNGFSMHFVVWLGNNQIIDPWDGTQKRNPYLVTNFRDIGIPAPPKPPASKAFSVRVDKAVANVRTAPKSSAPLGGSRQLFKGNTFLATGLVSGENVSGNNKWYRSVRNNYIWSGGLTKI